MKKVILTAAAYSFLAVNLVHGTVNFTDNFNSYANGNLAGLTADALGQGTWRQTGASAVTPVQVNSGTVVLGTSGQDVYSPLAQAIAITSGSSFYIAANIDITAAQATGDYFLHWSTPVGTTSTFVSRLFARSSGAGFQFGYLVTSGGAPVIAYGTTVLSFNIDYRVVVAYNSVAGTLNDTFSVYVNPTDTAVEGNNTAYVTGAYGGSTSPESTSVDAINLRQGTAANAPSVIVDNLVVATTFTEGATGIGVLVPEPSTIALASLGGLVALMAIRRRR